MATISPVDTKTLILPHILCKQPPHNSARLNSSFYYNYNTNPMTTQHDCSHLPGNQRCAIISPGISFCQAEGIESSGVTPAGLS